MRVIPVIDVMGGVCVHAVRGERSRYLPLRSVLCGTSKPLDVAVAFETCGFLELYLADLDSIMGKGDNQKVLRELTQNTRLKLMVDTGVSHLEQAERLLSVGVSKVVVGTETLDDLQFLGQAVEQFEKERIVVSLDLKAGKVIGKSEKMQSLSPLSLAKELWDLGISELIVLDLARVGSGEGVDFDLLKKLLSTLKIDVLVGGGVRDMADLSKIKNLGANGVLLATALHSGAISAGEVQRFAKS